MQDDSGGMRCTLCAASSHFLDILLAARANNQPEQQPFDAQPHPAS
jgi:hypothetical protein